MNTLDRLLQVPPLILFHLACALGTLVLGALLMAGRKGSLGHRSLGWTWVVLMAATALSSVFIGAGRMPNIAGVSVIHVFTVVVLATLPRGVWYARRGVIVGHRKTMRGLFWGGCVVAGAFTLLPGRVLGRLVWG